MLSRFLSRTICPCKQIEKFCTATFSNAEASHDTRKEVAPVAISRPLQFPSLYQKPRQAWVYNIDSLEKKNLGMIDLHPEVFGAHPRIDIIHRNVVWQQKYRHVSYANTKTRAEVRGGGRKPWPQKGLGKARHGSIRSPLWKGGGVAHGPRSPTTHFFMLPYYLRVLGLTTTLSVKFAQDDLHIVESLDIPTEDSKYIEDLLKKRNWGSSVLMVDNSDLMPKNISLATDGLAHVNLMPVYGLNVYSMLKHDALILTLAAVNAIEEKLIHNLYRNDGIHTQKKFKINQN